MSLYDTFVCQMTGKELVDLIRHAAEGVNTVKEEAKRNLAYGVRELGAAIGCSESTIYTMKKTGVLDTAIISQIGRKIIFDVDKSRILADDHQRNQRQERRNQAAQTL